MLRRRRAQTSATREQKVTHAHQLRTQRVHAFICPYGAGLKVPVSLVMENTRTLFVSCRSEAVLFTYFTSWVAAKVARLLSSSAARTGAILTGQPARKVHSRLGRKSRALSTLCLLKFTTVSQLAVHVHIGTVYVPLA